MSPIQRPTPRAPAQHLGQCLGQLERQWQSEGSLAALWQAWPEIAGAQLAPHCRPLALRGNTLLVGASQPQWLQALHFWNTGWQFGLRPAVISYNASISACENAKQLERH